MPFSRLLIVSGKKITGGAAGVSYCEDCVTLPLANPCFDWRTLCQTPTLLNKIWRKFSMVGVSLNYLGKFHPK